MNRAIVDGVHWVGFVDWNIRDFHGYVTDRGSTYNAYLVLDREPALVDSVKAPYAADLLRNVAELMDPADLRWVVCNHAEPDHSGALPAVMAACPNATLVPQWPQYRLPVRAANPHFMHTAAPASISAPQFLQYICNSPCFRLI